MKKTDSIHWCVFAIGVWLFIGSCAPLACETYIQEVGWTEDRVRGLDALLMGWFLILAGCPAWIANPLIVVAAVLMNSKMWSLALATATSALGCGLTILIWYTPFPTYAKNEGILRLGGVMWLSAIACMWLSTWVAWVRNQPRTKLEAVPDA